MKYTLVFPYLLAISSYFSLNSVNAVFSRASPGTAVAAAAKSRSSRAVRTREDEESAEDADPANVRIPDPRGMLDFPRFHKKVDQDKLKAYLKREIERIGLVVTYILPVFYELVDEKPVPKKTFAYEVIYAEDGSVDELKRYLEPVTPQFTKSSWLYIDYEKFTNDEEEEEDEPCRPPIYPPWMRFPCYPDMPGMHQLPGNVNFPGYYPYPAGTYNPDYRVMQPFTSIDTWNGTVMRGADLKRATGIVSKKVYSALQECYPLQYDSLYIRIQVSPKKGSGIIYLKIDEPHDTDDDRLLIISGDAYDMAGFKWSVAKVKSVYDIVYVPGDCSNLVGKIITAQTPTAGPMSPFPCYPLPMPCPPYPYPKPCPFPSFPAAPLTPATPSPYVPPFPFFPPFVPPFMGGAAYDARNNFGRPGVPSVPNYNGRSFA